MLLADVKVMEHRIVYIDMVRACLEDLNLVLKPINASKLASTDQTQEAVYI